MEKCREINLKKPHRSAHVRLHALELKSIYTFRNSLTIWQLSYIQQMRNGEREREDFCMALRDASLRKWEKISVRDWLFVNHFCQMCSNSIKPILKFYESRNMFLMLNVPWLNDAVIFLASVASWFFSRFKAGRIYRYDLNMRASSHTSVAKILRPFKEMNLDLPYAPVSSSGFISPKNKRFLL